MLCDRMTRNKRPSSVAAVPLIGQYIFHLLLSYKEERCLSVHLKLKISVTTQPIGRYSLGNIPTGSVIGFKLFSCGGNTPNPLPQKEKKIPPPKKKFFIFFLNLK